MNAVATQPHVTLSGDVTGEYVVEEERPDGRLVLMPDVSWTAIRERMGAGEPTPDESAEFWREYGSHMLPPDSEG